MEQDFGRMMGQAMARKRSQQKHDFTIMMDPTHVCDLCRLKPKPVRLPLWARVARWVFGYRE